MFSFTSSSEGSSEDLEISSRPQLLTVDEGSLTFLTTTELLESESLNFQVGLDSRMVTLLLQAIDGEFNIPQSLRVKLWRKSLGISRFEKFPDNIDEVELNQSNQKVIRYDCERTRSSLEEFRSPEIRKAMEAMLTFFCSSRRLKYKQGMNEILAPFVFLKISRSIDTWQECFDLFSLFYEKFFPVIYEDDDFHHLQTACIFFRSLLRYHSPTLCSRLDAFNVPPELYVTPWFLTLFASKTHLSVVLKIWDLFICGGDAKFFPFFGVSICMGACADLQNADRLVTPQILSNLVLTDKFITGVFRRALKIRQSTPAGLVMDSPSESIAEGVSPVYVTPQEVMAQIGSRTKRFFILDCRPERIVGPFSSGRLPESLGVSFDLEELVSGRKVFPVCETFKRVAKLLRADSEAKAPEWPVNVHLVVMGITEPGHKPKLQKKDYLNVLYLCLARYCNVPRVSILKGGFLMLHKLFQSSLVSHNQKMCLFCRIESAGAVKNVLGT